MKKCMQHGRAAERRADRADHADRLLQDADAARSRRGGRLYAIGRRRWRNEVPPPIYKSAFAAPGVRRAPRRPMTDADMSDPGQARLLSRHHRPLHGVPHAGRRAAGIDFDNRSARAAGNSRAHGACRGRATSRRSKTRASAPGPTPRSRRAITQGKRKDGTQLKPPMGYQLLRQDDRRRSGRDRGLSADAAGEGIAALATSGVRRARDGGSAPFNCRAAAAYISVRRPGFALMPDRLRVAACCSPRLRSLLAACRALAQDRRGAALARGAEMSFAPIVKRVAPAVVNVYAAKWWQNRNPLLDDPIFRRFFGVRSSACRASRCSARSAPA